VERVSAAPVTGSLRAVQAAFEQTYVMHISQPCNATLAGFGADGSGMEN